MQTFSKQQVLFTGLTLIWSSLFFNSLTTHLEEQSYRSIPSLAGLYAALMFLSGLACGYFDSIRLTRIDIGYRYHLITFVVVHFVLLVILWIQKPAIDYFRVGLLFQFLLWGIGLLLHARRSKKSIKGYSAEELF